MTLLQEAKIELMKSLATMNSAIDEKVLEQAIETQKNLLMDKMIEEELAEHREHHEDQVQEFRDEISSLKDKLSKAHIEITALKE